VIYGDDHAFDQYWFMSKISVNIIVVMFVGDNPQYTNGLSFVWGLYNVSCQFR